MKRILALGLLFVALAFSFSSCQCSDKPEIGPVEQAATPAAAPAASRA